MQAASAELGLPTARYRFADSEGELRDAAGALGWPVVIKPIMSSSGKGQSVARTQAELETSWQYAQTGGRTGAGRERPPTCPGRPRRSATSGSTRVRRRRAGATASSR